MIKMEQEMFKQLMNQQGLIQSIIVKINITSKFGADMFFVNGSFEFLEELARIELNNLNILDSEKTLFEGIKEIIKNKKDKKVIKISFNQLKRIFLLAIDSMIERIGVVKDSVLESKEVDEHQEMIIMLEANQRLLQLIKSKMELGIKEKELYNLKDITFSLMRCCLYMTNDLKKEELKESLSTIKSVWREYHSINELIENARRIS